MSRVVTPPQPQAMPMTPSKMPMPMLTHEMIAQRAYERWCKRGRPHGTPMQDWLEAEAELKREMGMMMSAPAKR